MAIVVAEGTDCMEHCHAAVVEVQDSVEGAHVVTELVEVLANVDQD